MNFNFTFKYTLLAISIISLTYYTVTNSSAKTNSSDFYGKSDISHSKLDNLIDKLIQQLTPDELTDLEPEICENSKKTDYMNKQSRLVEIFKILMCRSLNSDQRIQLEEDQIDNSDNLTKTNEVCVCERQTENITNLIMSHLPYNMRWNPMIVTEIGNQINNLGMDKHKLIKYKLIKYYLKIKKLNN